MVLPTAIARVTVHAIFRRRMDLFDSGSIDQPNNRLINQQRVPKQNERRYPGDGTSRAARWFPNNR